MEQDFKYFNWKVQILAKLLLSCMSLIDSNDFINCAKFWKFPTFLPSSATTQLNSISTQTKADVSLISTFSSHPPMTVVSMEVKLKTLSRLPQEYFKTIFRLIQFDWASTQFSLKLWAWHYSAPACFLFLSSFYLVCPLLPPIRCVTMSKVASLCDGPGDIYGDADSSVLFSQLGTLPSHAYLCPQALAAPRFFSSSPFFHWNIIGHYYHSGGGKYS